MDSLERMRRRNTFIGRWDRGFGRLCLLVAATSGALVVNNYVDAAPLPVVTVRAAFDISSRHRFSDVPFFERAADFVLGMPMPVFCLISAILLSLLVFARRARRGLGVAMDGETAVSPRPALNELQVRPALRASIEAMSETAHASEGAGDRWHRAILAGRVETSAETGD